MPHLTCGPLLPAAPHPISRAQEMEMKTHLLTRAANLFAVIGAANRAAAATEGGRQPSRQTLRALAIDPELFGRIGH